MPRPYNTKPATTLDHAPFIRFLSTKQEEQLKAQEKVRPEVPVILAARALKPFFSASPTEGFPLTLIDDEDDGSKLKQQVINALTKPYGRNRPHPILRPLRHSSSWGDRVKTPDIDHLIALRGDQLRRLGRGGIDRELRERLIPLNEHLLAVIGATLPGGCDGEARFKLARLQKAFTAWAMAVIYATAYATLVDDHDGFVLFAPLAYVQHTAFLTGIDPDEDGRYITIFTR